jgi:hypothetical protein
MQYATYADLTDTRIGGLLVGFPTIRSSCLVRGDRLGRLGFGA